MAYHYYTVYGTQRPEPDVWSRVCETIVADSTEELKRIVLQKYPTLDLRQVRIVCKTRGIDQTWTGEPYKRSQGV